MSTNEPGRILQSLLDGFEDKYVISLASRSDRRQRVQRSFATLGIDFEASGIRWFDGLVFDADAGFPGIGVRGCFNSHYTLMRRCAQNGRPMLVMEDDIDLNAAAIARTPANIDLAGRNDWDLIYFGYLEPASRVGDTWLEGYAGNTIGAHFYAVQPDFAAAQAAFMESCLSRAPGHPDGGPMYRDAAFNFYRQRNPQWRTLVATPSLAGQFSSRSDLALKPALYDRLPVLRSVTEFSRRLLSRSA